MAFDKLTGYLDSFGELGIPACDCLVYIDHKPVYRHMRGFSDAAGKKPMDGHEAYFYYSATKIFTCVAVLQLIEEGKLGLDDPIYRYLPAFTMMTVADGDITRAARSFITVRHLMSMQSGMDYDLNAKAILNVLSAPGQNATTRQIVDAQAHKPLSFDPGTNYQYSLSHDVLGAIVEVVSGQRFGEYLKEHIMDPLGMKEVGFSLTDSLRSRLCAQYIRDEAKGETTLIAAQNPYTFNQSYESGGAGLIGGVDDYILLLDALACGGVGKSGARILRPKTIDLYRTPQLGAQSLASFTRAYQGYSYALGVRVMVDRTMQNAKSPNGEFGWDGAAGAFALADPENRLSVFYAQHVRGYSAMFHEIHPRIRDLVYEGLGL